MSKTKADSYEGVSNEDLLLRARMGDELAHDALVARCYAERHKLIYAACPTIAPQLSDWDINDAFFHGYLNAERTYLFGPVPFRSYLITCLCSSATNLIKSYHSKSNDMVTSYLDDPISKCEDSELTLGDVVGEEGTLDDPRAFFNYAETLAEYTRLPKKIDPIAIQLVKYHLDGYSIREAAEELDIPLKKASYLYARYLKWARSVLKSKAKGEESAE